MQYWIITSEYPPEYGGGIATYCLHNAMMLSKNGYEVSVFVSSEMGGEEVVTIQNGIRVVRFNYLHTNDTFLGHETARSFSFAKILKRYLIEEGIPVVLESQEYGGIAYFTLLYKHLHYEYFRNLKVLLTLHAPAFLYYEYNRVPSYRLPYFWVGEMEKWCIIAASKLNCPGNFLIDAIQPFFTQRISNEISVVPYPFKNESTPTITKDDNRNRWYFFGKMTPQKGIIPLLTSCQKLWNGGWNKRMTIIGGGDHYYHPENMLMSEWVKAKFAHELAKGQLVLLGNLSKEEWTRETKYPSVIVIPSIGDNYPFTVLESMSNGHIVLASKQGGQSEIIIHGENGFLFDHTIEGDLEAKILDIENLPLTVLQTIKNNAVNSVSKRHDYAEVFKIKSRLIKELLDKNETIEQFPFTRPHNKVDRGATTSPFSKGKLSVIVPFYNMGNTIKETLTSISNIEYDNYEVLVINDGSTDPKSINEINTLQGSFKFRLINQSNQGLSSARNKGVEEAAGEFIAFIDADDKVDSKFYKKAVSLLQLKKNIYFVGSWVNYFENSTGIWPSFTPEFPYLLYFNMVCGGGLVYKKSAYEEAGRNDGKLEYGLEDWESVISLVGSGRHGVVIPEPLYHYRIRKGSMARRFTVEKILFSTKYISLKHSSLYSQYAGELTSLLNANGPGYKIDNPTLDYEKKQSIPDWLPFKETIISTIRKSPFVKKIALGIYKAVKK